jgi:hypothetical protein
MIGVDLLHHGRALKITLPIQTILVENEQIRAIVAPNVNAAREKSSLVI